MAHLRGAMMIAVETYPVDVRDDGIYVATEPDEPDDTISKQMMEVAVDWGLEVIFGMVGTF